MSGSDLVARWVDSAGVFDRPAEAAAFRKAFGRESEDLVRQAMDEYLASPNRRGRATIADLGRVVERLRANVGPCSDEADLERARLGLSGGQMQRLGFRFDATQAVAPQPPTVVWAWFGDFVNAYLDRDPRRDEHSPDPKPASDVLDHEARRGRRRGDVGVSMEAVGLRLERAGWVYDPAADQVAAAARVCRAATPAEPGRVAL